MSYAVLEICANCKWAHFNSNKTVLVFYDLFVWYANGYCRIDMDGEGVHKITNLLAVLPMLKIRGAAESNFY